MEFVRRVCASPLELGLSMIFPFTKCPDLWELDTGDFAIIGVDITPRVETRLPPDVSVSPEERVILIPRKLLISAKNNIPAE